MYKPSNITPQESIAQELETIQSFLEAEYNADVAAAVQERFDDLGQYMARSGKLKADAEWHYNQLTESAIMTAIKEAYIDKMSISTLNKYVASLAKDVKFLLTWADRVNRACTHQLEGMRSVMSTLRSERFANNYGRN